MNNSVVYLHARTERRAPLTACSARRAEQNIQFTANYRARILITSVLYFTGEYARYDSFIWIKARAEHKLTKIYTLFWVKNIFLAWPAAGWHRVSIRPSQYSAAAPLQPQPLIINHLVLSSIILLIQDTAPQSAANCSDYVSTCISRRKGQNYALIPRTYVGPILIIT